MLTRYDPHKLKLRLQPGRWRRSILHLQSGIGSVGASQPSLKQEEHGEASLKLDKYLAWNRRPVCAPGQSTVAGLHAGTLERHRGGSRVEQVEPRAHHHRLRAGLCARRPPMRPSRRWAGSCLTSATPTTSRSRPSTASSRPAIFTPSTWPTLSASLPRSRRDRCLRPRHPELLGQHSTCRGDEAFEITAHDPAPGRSKVSRRRQEGRRGLPQNRRRQGRRQLHSRGLDGRDRPRAESRRAAHHPGRHRR